MKDLNYIDFLLKFYISFRYNYGDILNISLIDTILNFIYSFGLRWFIEFLKFSILIATKNYLYFLSLANTLSIF